MKRLDYLNVVGVEISEVEGGYEVYTDNGGDTDEVVYSTKKEVASRLEDIKYHYLDEYKEDGKPEDHPSHQQLNDLIEEFNN